MTEASPTETSPAELTVLLERWQGGEEQALAQLWSIVYRQVRELARHQFRREPAGHTLQPTALVNEAYVRLMGSAPAGIENRAHFFALVAKAMRQVLVDHARRKAAQKRAGREDRVTLVNTLADSARGASAVDALALHETLERLSSFRPRAAQVV
ncbi:MAG: ECF-type sigma factor, partial [Acidobacteriota bacterium]